MTASPTVRKVQSLDDVDLVGAADGDVAVYDQATGGLRTSPRSFYPALTAVEGVYCWAYGDSYMVVQAPANVSGRRLWTDLLARRLGTAARGASKDASGNTIDLMNSYTNRANNGYTAQDVACQALANKSGATPTQTWGQGNQGLVLLGVPGQNEYRTWPADTQGQQGSQHSLRAMLALFRSSSRTEETDSSFTYTSGTWTSSSDNKYSGGSLKRCSDLACQVSIAVSGTDFYLLTRGVQANGGTSEVKVDGVHVATVNHLNQCQTSPSAAIADVPIAIPILGLSAGAHTITLTKTDSDNTKNIYIDAILTVNPNPPLVLVMKGVHHPQADYDYWAANGYPGVSDASVDLFNGFIDSIAAEFPNVITADPMAAGFDPATCFLTIAESSPSARHPNDKGTPFFTLAAYRALKTKLGQGYLAGLNYL